MPFLFAYAKSRFSQNATQIFGQTEKHNNIGTLHEPHNEETCILHIQNKGADQLHGSQVDDQRLCCHFIDRTIPLLPKAEKFKPQAIYGCKAWFVWNLVQKPKDRFSYDMAHMTIMKFKHY